MNLCKHIHSVKQFCDYIQINLDRREFTSLLILLSLQCSWKSVELEGASNNEKKWELKNCNIIFLKYILFK